MSQCASLPSWRWRHCHCRDGPVVAVMAMSSLQASTWSLCHRRCCDTGVFALVALAPLPSLPLRRWRPRGHCDGTVASVTQAVLPLWHWRCDPCCAGSLLRRDCPFDPVAGGGTSGGLAAIASCRYSPHVPPGQAVPDPLVLLSLLFARPSSPCSRAFAVLFLRSGPPWAGPTPAPASTASAVDAS